MGTQAMTNPTATTTRSLRERNTWHSWSPSTWASLLQKQSGTWYVAVCIYVQCCTTNYTLVQLRTGHLHVPYLAPTHTAPPSRACMLQKNNAIPDANPMNHHNRMMLLAAFPTMQTLLRSLIPDNMSMWSFQMIPLTQNYSGSPLV